MRLVFCALVVVLFPSMVFAGTISVCDGCAVSDLRAAYELAEDGDEIVLAKGTHQVSELIIEKRLSISGKEGAVLDGNGLTIMYLHHDSISISNLTFQNVSTNYVEDRAAIKSNDSDYLRIENVDIRNSFFGLLIEKSKFGVIRNCRIIGNATKETYLESANGNAIHLWYCKHMTIKSNTVKHHRDGIYFEFVESSVIEDNLSEANMRYGLHFMFSHENLYEGNTFYRNGAGVAVMYSTKVTMISNQFVDNWGGSAYGLLLKDITDSELRGNIFQNNTIAISADNTMRCKIWQNRFLKNGYTLRVMGNCSDNHINENDFEQNSFDVVTDAQTNFNDFAGNYWEEYTGYDLDRDGVGDVPFRPVKLFTFIVAQAPASIILMRSTFIDLLNLAEKVTPVLTPESLIDPKPSMRPLNDHLNVRI